MATFIHERMKIIFIHVPKTGGMTVSNFFFPGSKSPERMAFSRHNEKLAIHAGIEDVREYLGDTVNEYFSFAYYRNTWDWSFSLYRYVKRTKSHPLYQTVESLSYEDYVWNVAEGFYRPQKPLVAPSSTIAVTRLDDYADFGSSFADILQGLGYQDTRYRSHNRATPQNYRSAYTRATMKKIGDIYEDDIDFFGFKF